MLSSNHTGVKQLQAQQEHGKFGANSPIYQKSLATIVPANEPRHRQQSSNILIDLRCAYGIESGTKDVEKSLEHHPIESNPILHILISVQFEAMKDRKDSREPHKNKHPSSVGSPSWSSEAVEN